MQAQVSHFDTLVMGVVGVYAVASTSQPGHRHTVRVFADRRVRCECPAASFGKPCRHARAVERFVRMLAGDPGEEEEEETRYGITSAGRAALERWRAQQAQQDAEAAARETAILRRSQQPFSLMR